MKSIKKIFIPLAIMVSQSAYARFADGVYFGVDVLGASNLTAFDVTLGRDFDSYMAEIKFSGEGSWLAGSNLNHYDMKQEINAYKSLNYGSGINFVAGGGLELIEKSVSDTFAVRPQIRAGIDYNVTEHSIVRFMAHKAFGQVRYHLVKNGPVLKQTTPIKFTLSYIYKV